MPRVEKVAVFASRGGAEVGAVGHRGGAGILGFSPRPTYLVAASWCVGPQARARPSPARCVSAAPAHARRPGVCARV